MNKTIRLGYLAGLKVMAKGNVVVGWLILWLVFSGVGLWLLDLPVGTAVLGGFLATLLHYLGELWHNLSHAFAARRTGYPMSGIMYFWVLGGSLYPPDEPELPAAVHIQRALGGPVGSLLLTAVMGLVAWGLRPLGGLPYGLALFAFADNLLVYTAGALLPLGFTDGSTLWQYWGQR